MTRHRHIWLIGLGVVGWLITAVFHPISAHPADMYAQTYTLHLTANGLTADWMMSPGPLLAASTWYEADQNQDEVVSTEEAAAWLTPLLQGWQTTIAGQPLIWQITAVAWPTDLTAFQLGDQRITASLTAPFPAPLGDTAALDFYNPFAEAISINWFYLSGDEGATFDRPQQENGRLRLHLTPPGLPPAPLTTWNSGTPSLTASEPTSPETADTPPSPSPSTPPPPPTDRRPYAILTELVRRESVTLSFYLTSLTIAIALGALHGLTPGHGKALVAAYLVGSRGTPQHAAALGGIVTLTHTGSVLIVGLITLAASRFLVPTSLFPWLEIASGGLIILMGLGLLQQRWRGWRAVQRQNTPILPKSPPYPPATSPPATSPSQTPPTSQRIAIGVDIPVKVYDTVLTSDPGLGLIQWRSLVALGISGGLVPCPDAIAILLVAVAINRIALGLSLIVSFSLGLAIVLIAIGLAMVQGSRLARRFGQVERLAPALSVLSALIVLGLGLTLTVRAALGTGLLTAVTGETAVGAAASPPTTVATGKATLSKSTFDMTGARILYVVLDEQGRYQLYAAGDMGGTVTQLTQTPYGIWNYALSPDKQSIVYAALRADRGSDLWLMAGNGRNAHQLLACPQADCRNATWSPDGSRLVFERLDISDPTAQTAPTLWWLELATGESAPLFQDSQLPGFSPAWSPDGNWLGYIAPGTPTKIQLYNLTDGSNHTFTTLTSMSVAWHPMGTAVLFTEINQATLQPGQPALTHLYRYDVADDDLRDISGVDSFSDSWPDWSADGEWVVFARRDFSGETPQRGNQLWVMRADGTAARPLTAEPDTLHQQPVWSPDGRFVVYHQYNLGEPMAKPTVKVITMETGEMITVASPGSQPRWLP